MTSPYPTAPDRSPPSASASSPYTPKSLDENYDDNKITTENHGNGSKTVLDYEKRPESNPVNIDKYKNRYHNNNIINNIKSEGNNEDRNNRDINNNNSNNNYPSKTNKSPNPIHTTPHPSHHSHPVHTDSYETYSRMENNVYSPKNQKIRSNDNNLNDDVDKNDDAYSSKQQKNKSFDNVNLDNNDDKIKENNIRSPKNQKNKFNNNVNSNDDYNNVKFSQSPKMNVCVGNNRNFSKYEDGEKSLFKDNKYDEDDHNTDNLISENDELRSSKNKRTDNTNIIIDKNALISIDRSIEKGSPRSSKFFDMVRSSFDPNLERTSVYLFMCIYVFIRI